MVRPRGAECRNAARGAREAALILNAYLDEQLAARGLTDADLALVGFSQGTMMALHVGLRRTNTLAAIVGYSGMLVAPELLATEMTSKPPVLLVHGMDDQVLPFEAMGQAEAALKGARPPGPMPEGRPGLPHSIDQRGPRTRRPRSCTSACASITTTATIIGGACPGRTSCGGPKSPNDNIVKDHTGVTAHL